MIGSPFAVGVAKVAAVGILMAAGGGVYIASRTGDPGPGDPPVTFKATPTRNIVNELGTDCTLDFLNRPDRITVAMVTHESLKAVEEWINEVGLEVLGRRNVNLDLHRYVSLRVRVPYGAAYAASRALAGRAGVLSVEEEELPRDPTPCGLDDASNCGSFFPDRVTVLVSRESLKAVEEWINEVGFEVLERTDEDFFVILHVRVPIGALQDAIRAVAEREGVLSAGSVATREGPTPCPY